MSDIMGGSGDRGLDISDEALEARGWEPDTSQNPEGVNDAPDADDAADFPPVEGEGDTPDSIEADGEVEDVDDDPAGDADDGEGGDTPDDADDDLPFEVPEKYKGKSPEEIARLALAEEGFRNKQLDELREQMQLQQQQLQQQQAEYAAWLAAQQQAQYDPHAQLAGLEPVPAYNTALQLLDQGLADPGIVNQVIAETRQLDPDLAFEMARDFDRRIIRAEQQQLIQQQVAPLQQQAFVQTAQAASAEFMASEPDAAEYQADIAKIVQSNPSLLGDRSPAAIRTGLQQALVQARGADITRSSAFKQQLAAEKSAAQVEQGGAPKQAPMSEVDRIRAEVFGSKDPADALFS